MNLSGRAKAALGIAMAQILSLLPAFGQINGVVFTDQKKPLEAAAVSLILAKDSSLIKVALSESDGTYHFEGLKSGQYKISLAMMGFQNYQSEIIFVDAMLSPISLQPIVLTSSDLKLKEVKITGQKNFVEYKIDRTVINVDALISNAGSNVLEVLEKSPGVILDQSGNISLKGQSGVLVMIDNRPTYLSAQALVAYLRSLPSGTVDQIELITNPPARYDAAGSAGIINIRTKKSKVRGFNGSVSATAGRSTLPKHNESVNLNYRRNQFNFFTNASFNSNDSWRKLDIGRRYFDENSNPLSSFNQTTYFYPKNRTTNLKAGLDFYANRKTTLGFVYFGAYSKATENRPVNSGVFGFSGLLDSLIQADNSERKRFNQHGFNVNFSHQFDSSGHSITLDLDFVKYNIFTKQNFLNRFLGNLGQQKNQEQITANLPSDIRIYTARTDYERSLKGKAKIAAGLKGAYVATDNAANYFLHNQEQISVDLEKTNRFLYRENINAAYLNFNKDYRRLSVQLGLRAENTNLNGHQIGNALKPDSAFSRHYTSLFPTAYLSYKLDSNNTKLNLSYGRRIGRPFYQDLNPFVFLLDKFSYFAGNPFLKPELSSKLMIAVNYKSRYNLSFQFNYTTNMQGEVIEQKDNVFISRTGNISRLMWGGISLTANLIIGEWYKCNFYAEVIMNNFRGMPGNPSQKTGSTYGYLSPNNQFLFKDGWSAEISGFCITRSQSAQFDKAPMYLINMAVQKKVLDGKGTVKVLFRDVFSSLNPNGTIGNIPNATATYRNDADTRAVLLTFTYSFSKGSAVKSKRNAGGSGSEEGRVKN